MKTIIYFSAISLVLFFISTGSLLSQDTQPELQSQKANWYMYQFDSLNTDNDEKTGLSLELKNQGIDSLIRTRANCIDNRIYLADTNTSQNKSEIIFLII